MSEQQKTVPDAATVERAIKAMIAHENLDRDRETAIAVEAMEEIARMIRFLSGREAFVPGRWYTESLIRGLEAAGYPVPEGVERV